MIVTDYLRDKFSFSKLSTFSRCPRKAFYRYIMKKKELGVDFLLYGRAVHAGQEYDNLEKLKGKEVPVGEVLDAATASLEVEAKKEGVIPAVDTFWKEHEKQLGAFETSGERAKIVPVPGTVEATFQLHVDVSNVLDEGSAVPAVVEGFVDVVSRAEDGRAVVVDYKSTERPFNSKDVTNSLQMSLYELGAETDRSKFVSFVKQGKQKPTTKVSSCGTPSQVRTEKTLTFLGDTISSFRRCVKTGDWPKCDPSCHWCSPKACDFYELCYPRINPELSKFISISEVKPVGTLPQPDWRKSK